MRRLKVDYVHAKKAAENIVLAAAAKGADAVVVNPAYLIGPEDHENSIMGRFCLRFWRGKIPLIPRGGLNFVDVRDAACGHLLAAEKGQAARRYILGGENRTLMDFTATLAEVRGEARLRLPMPLWLQAAIAWFAERRAVIREREPHPSMQHVRMNRYDWYYSSQRAQAELGYQARPIQTALADAHRWFCDNGWLTSPEPLRKDRDVRAAA